MDTLLNPEKDKYLLSSVCHALQILDLLSEHDELGAAEVSKMLSIGKSSAFRILYTLENGAFVTKSHDAKYRLGYKFAHYGELVVSRQNLAEACRSEIIRLRDEQNEAVHLAVLVEDGQMQFIYKQTPTNTFSMTSRIGSERPAYATATGKMLLSDQDDEEIAKIAHAYSFQRFTENTIHDPEELIEELSRIRRRGYSEDAEESEIGLTCYSRGIRDYTGRFIAALSISGPTTRMRPAKERLLDALEETCDRLSAKLGYLFMLK